MEFESQINSDFKKACLQAFEKALDECARQHEACNDQYIKNGGKYGGADYPCLDRLFCTTQPKKLSLKLEYFWDTGTGITMPKLYCGPVVLFPIEEQ